MAHMSDIQPGLYRRDDGRYGFRVISKSNFGFLRANSKNKQVTEYVFVNAYESTGVLHMFFQEFENNRFIDEGSGITIVDDM